MRQGVFEMTSGDLAGAGGVDFALEQLFGGGLGFGGGGRFGEVGDGGKDGDAAMTGVGDVDGVRLAVDRDAR